MFCFPYGGSGASVFRAWPNLLPATIEVCAVQLPGRETRLRETAMDRVPDVVTALADALTPEMDRPYVLLGSSVGALLSFELARELRRRGVPGPQALVAMARNAPHVPYHGRQLHRLEGAVFVDALRRLGGTPDGVLDNSQLLAAYTPLLRADFALTETYVYTPEAPLDCPLEVFGGVDDTTVARMNLDAWRVHTRAAFGLTMVPGGHFFINTHTRDFIGSLCERLAHGIVRADGVDVR